MMTQDSEFLAGLVKYRDVASDWRWIQFFFYVVFLFSDWTHLFMLYMLGSDSLLPVVCYIVGVD